MKNYDVLNELVPKTQELHRAIFDKGYEQGFKDGANSEYEHDHEVIKAYNDGQTYILNKVRAEIEGKIIKRPKMDFRYGERDHNEAILDVLSIIDKYRG